MLGGRNEKRRAKFLHCDISAAGETMVCALGGCGAVLLSIAVCPLLTSAASWTLSLMCPGVGSLIAMGTCSDSLVSTC